jgi:hypothetical protein
MGAVGLSIAWRLRYLILALAIVGAVWWAYSWFTGVLEERDQLRVAVERVEAVNRENARVTRELQIEWAFEREATARSLKQSAERLAKSQQIIREMRDVPGYNDPAGPVWDAYSRKLRPHGH